MVNREKSYNITNSSIKSKKKHQVFSPADTMSPSQRTVLGFDAQFWIWLRASCQCMP